MTAAIADAAGEARPVTAEELRATWELVRVIPRSAVVERPRPRARPGSRPALAPVLRLHRDVSEPLELTLSQLQRWPIEPLAPDRAAFVVENPALTPCLAQAMADQGTPCSRRSSPMHSSGRCVRADWRNTQRRWRGVECSDIPVRCAQIFWLDEL
ncbi:MAG: hypothetical protein JXA83_11715 [Acidimicrobiales bacterium]|nr:hypothetical protein [Acidimicrobiales bacterium]